MKNVIWYKKGKQSWVEWIKKRIDNNLNFLAIAEGPTGIGKSWAMLRICEDIDPEFDPVNQIAFSFVEFMRIINKFNNHEKDDNPLSKKKYKVIMFDEVQTDLSNRAWQSKINQLFNYLISTFRHQNIIVLFTSPYSDFVDSATMKLIHCKFEVRGHNRKKKKTHVRPKLLQYNSKMKKWYEHSLHVVKNGKMRKMVNWLVSKPSERIIKPYELKKQEFTEKLNRRITMELENMELEKDKPKVDKEGRREKSVHKPLTELQAQVLECWKLGMIQKNIAIKLNKKPSTICESEKFMRNKGYYRDEYHKSPKLILQPIPNTV